MFALFYNCCVNKSLVTGIKHRISSLVFNCHKLTFAFPLALWTWNRWIEAVYVRDTAAEIATRSVVDIERINYFRLSAVLADKSFLRTQNALQTVILSKRHNLLQHLFESSILNQRQVRNRVKMNRFVNIFFSKKKFLQFRNCALRASEDISSNEVEFNAKLLQSIHLIDVGIDVRVQNLKTSLSFKLNEVLHN